MIEPLIIITNNKMVVEKLGCRFETVKIEGILMDVLILVRDYVHKGYRLLTHPLAGSIKPNETPYKTVLISNTIGKTIDMESLLLIENSIQLTEKLIATRKTPEWTKEILDDFSLIDYDLIYHAIN